MTGFWLFMLVMILLIPGAMMGIGLWFRNHAPRQINGFFGYRTARSMKTPETWDFANALMGRIWRKTGIVLGVLSLVAMLFSLGWSEDSISAFGLWIVVFQIFGLILPLFAVETALKRTFDADGRRIF